MRGLADSFLLVASMAIYGAISSNEPWKETYFLLNLKNIK